MGLVKPSGGTGDKTYSDITLLSGWTNSTNGGTKPMTLSPTRYIALNGWVHVKGVLDANSVTSNIMFNIPQGYRPKESFFVSTIRTQGGILTATKISVNANGNVSIIETLTDATLVIINFSYPLI